MSYDDDNVSSPLYTTPTLTPHPFFFYCQANPQALPVILY